MRNLIIRFRILSVTLLFIARSASAQYDPSASASLGMGHGYTALTQSVMSNAFAATSKSSGATKAANADYVYLGFSHFREFEQKIFEQVLQTNKSMDKGKMRSFLSSTRTMYHFNTRARAYGLKDTYVSDLLATGIAWNWEMYHRAKPAKEKVISLRNAIRSNMAKNSIKNQITKLSEAEKRTWILSFMYNNSMLAQIIKNAGKLGPEQKQQLIKTAAQAGVPDIATVSLR
ncbi:hypothetical protein [Pedobacter sp. SYP-B3415]|uniref:hypothetical protein n=1 Tax=Pedobacter sp. SYP-B3415 TaxID=2496641 RepID=UPI00101CAEFD|nr:hypothetical protein [Pedobacter sp. SYP-B3415]